MTPKIRLSFLLFWGLALPFALAIAGCFGDPFNDPYKDPASGKWVYSHETARGLPTFRPARRENGKLIMVTPEVILNRVMRKFGPPRRIDAKSERYLVAEYEWMEEMSKWWNDGRREFDVDWHESAFDCEDYARGLAGYGALSAVRENLEAPLFIGMVKLIVDGEWIGVKDGRIHAVVVVATDKGLFVWEPQNGEIFPLMDLKAREITAFYLF